MSDSCSARQASRLLKNHGAVTTNISFALIQSPKSSFSGSFCSFVSAAPYQSGAGFPSAFGSNGQLANIHILPKASSENVRSHSKLLWSRSVTTILFLLRCAFQKANTKKKKRDPNEQLFNALFDRYLLIQTHRSFFLSPTTTQIECPLSCYTFPFRISNLFSSISSILYLARTERQRITIFCHCRVHV